MLLFLGLHSKMQAQVVLDSVSIFLPYGMDTSCPGTQLMLYAVQSNDTFSTSEYHWYINSTYTGVRLDTLYTTAPVDGDTISCHLVYRNSLGLLDSFTSNSIVIHRSTSIRPRVAISLTHGTNPDCSYRPLTFYAFPVNGGTAPAFQWLRNGLPIPTEDSQAITRIFADGDTISVQMIGNSACSAPYNDTAISSYVVISRDSITASISIITTRNPICLGTVDTFDATIANYGVGASLAWYVNSTLVPTALGPELITSSLHNGDIVYCILRAPDPCVINDTTVSNVVTMTVITPLSNTAYTILTRGANPGCLDSPVTFTGHYTNFGVGPAYDWYVNGVMVAHDTTVFTNFYLNGDVVTFKVHPNDNGCYINDTFSAPSVLMIRDSTPVTPLVSLIGDLLIANSRGHYIWYVNTVNSCVGGHIVPGAIDQTFHPIAPGYYYAVKDTNNCQSVCSNVIYISLLDVKNVYKPTVKIFPNPTTGVVNLDWEGRTVNMKLEVYDLLGHGLLHQDIVNRSTYETDLSYLPEGNYLLVLKDEDGTKSTHKIYISK